MTVAQLITALESIKDKSQECYFDITPTTSAYFIFRSIDIIEQVSNDKDENMIVLSCGLEDSINQIYLN